MSTVTNHVTQNVNLYTQQCNGILTIAQTKCDRYAHSVPKMNIKKMYYAVKRLFFNGYACVKYCMCAVFWSPSGYVVFFFGIPFLNILALIFIFNRMFTRCPWDLCFSFCVFCLNYLFFSCYLFRFCFAFWWFLNVK